MSEAGREEVKMRLSERYLDNQDKQTKFYERMALSNEMAAVALDSIASSFDKIALYMRSWKL